MYLVHDILVNARWQQTFTGIYRQLVWFKSINNFTYRLLTQTSRYTFFSLKDSTVDFWRDMLSFQFTLVLITTWLLARILNLFAARLWRTIMLGKMAFSIQKCFSYPFITWQGQQMFSFKPNFQTIFTSQNIFHFQLSFF